MDGAIRQQEQEEEQEEDTTEPLRDETEENISSASHNDTERLTKSNKLKDILAHDVDRGIVYDTPSRRVPYSGPIYRHPYLLSHKRLVGAVIMLLLLSIGFVILGISMLGAGEGTRSIIFFVLAVIAFLPGAYQATKIYRKIQRSQQYIASEYEADDDDQ